MGFRAILQHHVHGMQDKIQTIRYTNVAFFAGYSDRGRIEWSEDIVVDFVRPLQRLLIA
jgi:hypothetical protein